MMEKIMDVDQITMADVHMGEALVGDEHNQCALLPAALIVRPLLEVGTPAEWGEVLAEVDEDYHPTLAADTENFWDPEEVEEYGILEPLAVDAYGFSGGSMAEIAHSAYPRGPHPRVRPGFSCGSAAEGMATILSHLLQRPAESLERGVCEGVATGIISITQRGILQDYPAVDVIIGLCHMLEAREVDAGEMMAAIITWEPVEGMPLDLLIEMLMAQCGPQHAGELTQGEEPICGWFDDPADLRPETLTETREREIAEAGWAVRKNL